MDSDSWKIQVKLRRFERKPFVGKLKYSIVKLSDNVWASAFHLWDRGFDSRYGLMMWKESVNSLPKVVGFLRALRFPPTCRESCQGGLGQESCQGGLGVRWLGIVYLVILKDLKPSNVSKISFNCNESNIIIFIYTAYWKITHFVFSLYIFS
jgi:hypothetical protein